MIDPRTEAVVESRFTDHPVLLFALTLRGPSGGHCVELKEGLKNGCSSPYAGGPPGLQRGRLFLPESPTQWPPGGPPEGQCETEDGPVTSSCDMTVVDPFRTDLALTSTVT